MRAETYDVECSIVIPCYNEEDAIEETIKRIENAMCNFESYELVVVNDGSTDGTKEVLGRIIDDHPEVVVVTLETNHGYGFALKSGIAVASGEYVAIGDADGTYPLERFPELITMCRKFDMVVGARVADDVEYSKLRAFPKYFLKRYISWIVKYRVPDINSGLRVFRRDIARKFISIFPDGFSFTTTITVVMHTNFYRVHYEPITYKRRIGKSKIHPIKDTLRFFQLIVRTGMYFAPLRMLMPFIQLLSVLSVGSFGIDVFVYQNLTDTTVLLGLFTFNTVLLGLLADSIAKRGNVKL